MDGAGLQQETHATPQEWTVRFAPVRTDKFIVLNLLTFGFYGVVWLYRSWRYVRDAEESSAWPWARAFFAPLWYYPLLRRLGMRGKGGLTAAFWLIAASWRLPDPFWLASIFSFLPLLPAVGRMNELNGTARQDVPSYGWRVRSGVVATLGVLATPFVVAGTFGPPTTVLTGAELPGRYVDYLHDAGLLEDDEKVLYFYSGGFMSIHSDGVMATDLGITSYWVDPISDELSVAFLAYEEIRDIEVNPASHALEDTAVRVNAHDGSWFLFFLSAENGGDRRFLDEVDRRRGSVMPGQITA